MFYVMWGGGVIAIVLCPMAKKSTLDCPWLSTFLFVSLGDSWFLLTYTGTIGNRGGGGGMSLAG